MRWNRAMAAAAAVIVFSLSAVVALAASGVPYTFHDVDQQMFTDEGLCAPSATITVNGRYWLHVNATEAGLTQEEVEEALFTGDPEGILTSVTFTEVGTFTAVEDGHTYTGRFTNWFGGNVNHDGHTTVFTGTFSVRGTDENGNRVTANFRDHVTLVNGEVVTELEGGSTRGCP